VSSDELSEFDIELAHARIGLEIHAHEPLFLTKHFSGCNDSAGLIVWSWIEFLNRKNLDCGSLNRFQVCLSLIDLPSRITQTHRSDRRVRAEEYL